MAAPPRRRLRPVRLTEIPLHVRRKHGEKLLRELRADHKLLEAVQLTGAIEDPSDRVYFVPVDAVGR